MDDQTWRMHPDLCRYTSAAFFLPAGLTADEAAALEKPGCECLQFDPRLAGFSNPTG